MKKRQCVGCEQWLPANGLFEHGVGLHCRPCIEDDDLRCGRCAVCRELDPPLVCCGYCDAEIPASVGDIQTVAKKPICALCLESLQAGRDAERAASAAAAPFGSDP